MRRLCGRRSAAQGTPLRSSVVATGCGMRRAEKSSSAAGLPVKREQDAPVWKSERGRKHANEDALQREMRREVILSRSPGTVSLSVLIHPKRRGGGCDTAESGFVWCVDPHKAGFCSNRRTQKMFTLK